jgi:hypothetical protein
VEWERDTTQAVFFKHFFEYLYKKTKNLKIDLFIMKYLIVLTFCLFIVACRYQPNKFSGIIKDDNQKAVSHCPISFILWKEGFQSETISSKLDTFSDENGRFEINVSDVIMLSFVVKVDSFYPFLKGGVYINNRNNVDVNLTRQKETFSAISSFDHSRKPIKIGVENEIISDVSTLCSVKGKIPNSNIVVWLESKKSNFENSVIHTNATNGGILPIYESDINSSIYFDLLKLPLNGYKNEHKINGNEIGFFIKSDKAFIKLIKQNNTVDGSSPIPNGYYTFMYMYFDWISNNINDMSIRDFNFEKQY